MPLPSEIPEILLLSESENASVVDRRALRDAGFANTRVMTSGIEAAQFLAGMKKSTDWNIPSAVICSQKLEDMDGEQFCAIIRQHPALISLPVLLLLPNDNDAEQLKVMGCGASAFLGRPYSVSAMRQLLLGLVAESDFPKRVGEAFQNVDTSAFEAALANYGLLLLPEKQADDYFRVGMKCLEEKKWNMAICAFQYVLQNEGMEAEAQLGMAAAAKGKGDMAAFRLWLGRASETLIKAKRWQRARSSYARLLQHDPEAKNPFFAEARRLVRQKEYDEAAGILAQGVSIIPKTKSGDQLASICLGAEDPDAMMRALAMSLEQEDKNNNYLSAEIRQNLEIKTREREDRQKALAAERKWQLSRQMAEKRNAAKEAADEKLSDTQPKVEPVKKGITKAAGLENSDPFPEIDETATSVKDDADSAKQGQVLAPFTRHEVTSELFGNTPRINEFLSVIKLTWKLARRAGKKDKGG